MLVAMLINLLWAAGVIFLILALLAFFNVIAFAWVTFLIVAVICLVVAYALGRRGAVL